MDDGGHFIVELALVICIISFSLIVAMIFLMPGLAGGSR